MLRRVRPVLSQELNNGRAYNGTVGNLRHVPCLLRGGNAEADGAGNGGILPDHLDDGRRSILISLRVPVTPRLDTMCRNPVASFAIMAMRFSEVGALMEISSSLS